MVQQNLPDPFACGVRGLAEARPGQEWLRSATPLRAVAAPAGGPVWVVTDEALARAVLTDPRISKDTAWAPAAWRNTESDLEPTAAQRPSLTTLEGSAHVRIRKAHAALLGRRPVAERAERIAATASALLAAAGPEVDLMADFTTRYPLGVILDLVGVPPELFDEAAAACRGMVSDDPAERGAAFGRLNAVSASALGSGRDGLGAQLRARLGDELTDDEIGYLLFGLVFAGQLTTDAALGFLLAYALGPDFELETADREQIDALVEQVLRRHPPAPFTLWRFATTEIELAGTPLPAGSPILVDVLGINAGELAGPMLSFGHGFHYCIGAHLARLELRTVLEVLRDEHPHARLAVPFDELQQADLSPLQGSRLVALPVVLGRNAG